MSFERVRGHIGKLMFRGASKPVVHLELHTGDMKGARDFYADLFGWRHERIDTPSGSYEILDLAHGLGGGIVECEIAHSLWLPYVEVSEIAEATERASQSGASVLLPAREGPAGWRSVLATPAGGEIALWQPKR
jgi:predicted enzyme related to lactoylglutathione lyase